MIRLFGAVLLSFISLIGFAQDEMPNNIDDVIKWNFDVKYEGDEATIIMNVDQKNGWHIYSQVQPEGAIPLPTELIYQPSPNYSLIGKTKEYGAQLTDNEGFPEKSFHGNKAKFEQKIKIKSAQNFKIVIEYTYMACKTACLPPETRKQELTIKGTSQTSTPDQVEIIEDTTEEVDTTESFSSLDPSIAGLAGTCEGFAYTDIFDPVRVFVSQARRSKTREYLLSIEIKVDSIFAMYAFDSPNGYKSAITFQQDENLETLEPFDFTVGKNQGDNGYLYNVMITQKVVVKDTTHLPMVKGSVDLYLKGCQTNFHSSSKIDFSFDLTTALDSGDRDADHSLLLVFLLAFVGGLLALLTPCVFPMIPMTVTFFTKQSKTKAEGLRKAGFYSFCIIIIYVILGVLVSFIAGEDALNAMATNPWVNIAFFVLFMVFAVSFLGAFEITLPASWVNKADKQADRGGMIGIFFMAFTLALVSFSCTGPIVGTVLVQSAQGGLIGPIIAMLGFSAALAIPFGLFAAFPGWLNSLPQSGGWLNTVKIVLGFLEMAFALKFFSNADLVKQWHFLERELFLGIWIGIFLVLAIYLLGLIHFPHDTKNERLSVGRGMFATLVIGFVIYLIPGMWGAPLKMISGFPPPLTYAESKYGIGNSAPDVEEGWPESTVAHGHGINVVRDYDEALAYAKKVDKPLLLDFTGWACVNCRKMEEFVWADESVSPLMANNFVVASLYVDDRGDLPAKYVGSKDRNGDLMETIGDKWTDMQVTRYQQVTQPMYIVVDHHENPISSKADYQSHREVPAFKLWLEGALKQYEAGKKRQEIIPTFEKVN